MKTLALMLALSLGTLGLSTYAADAPPPNLPPGVTDVVKLAKAGMSDDVILAQIKGAGASYNLTVDQIIYLSQAGVSQPVIKALMGPGKPAEPVATQEASQALPPQPTPPVGQPPSLYATQAPQAPTSLSMTVPANVRWFDTGIELRPGQLLTLSARGEVFIGVNIYRQVAVTPDGLPGEGSHHFQSLVPGLPAYALVGKVGPFGTPFLVGVSTSLQVPAGGKLYLSANTDTFPFNRGSWQVVAELGDGSQTLASAPPDQPSPEYFQQQLSPYGQWVQTSAGVVWVPTVASQQPGWRPYANDGHWAETDQGLYWQSDPVAPYGDLVFHYGRWYVDANFGWAWVPGYDWAPAWVAWRHGEAEGFIGWAPLPPEAEMRAGVGLVWRGHEGLGVDVEFGLGADAYVFLPADRLWEPGYRGIFLGRERYGYFYGHSEIHNGYRFEGGRFHVDGIGRERLGVLTHHEVRVERSEDIAAREEREHFDARHAEVAHHMEVHPELVRGDATHPSLSRGFTAPRPVAAKPTAMKPTANPSSDPRDGKK